MKLPNFPIVYQRQRQRKALKMRRGSLDDLVAINYLPSYHQSVLSTLQDISCSAKLYPSFPVVSPLYFDVVSKFAQS